MNKPITKSKSKSKSKSKQSTKRNQSVGWRAPVVRQGQDNLVKIINPHESDPQWKAADQLLKSFNFEA